MITNDLTANWGVERRYKWEMEMDGYCVDDCGCGSNLVTASGFGYWNLLVRMHVSI